jgi:hypothetical protein
MVHWVLVALEPLELNQWLAVAAGVAITAAAVVELLQMEMVEQAVAVAVALLM